MKLIHLNEYKHRDSVYKLESIRRQFASGMAMSQCMHQIQMFCHEGARDKNDSAVIWETNHHEVVLWFEDEKYMTYFNLRMEGKGA